MARQLSEKQVLKKLDIPDFRHLTKEKAIEFVSMLPQMDPEVAKKALEQFPELAKTTLEMAKDYKETLEKGLEDNSESTRACYATLNAVIESLSKELEREDLTDEERSRVRDDMMELARLASQKDVENKKFILKVLSVAAVTVVAIVGTTAAALGGSSHLGLVEPEDEEEE